jgi:hypothetical protein
MNSSAMDVYFLNPSGASTSASRAAVRVLFFHFGLHFSFGRFVS